MRKVLSGILFVILVFPLMLGAMTTVSVTSWALDRQFYMDTFDQPEVHQALTSSRMIDQFISGNLNLPPEADTVALEEVLQGILTDEYMREQVSAFINDLFDFLQGKSDTFEPTINITPLKDAISGDQQDEFLTALVAAIPVCEAGQTPGFGETGGTACKPAGFSDEQIIEQALKPTLPATLAAVPDEIPVDSRIADRITANRWRGFLPGMAIPASIILSVVTLAFSAVLMWYLTALIAGNAWRTRLQWLGWMLLIPAVIVFLMSISTQGGLSAYWIRFGLERADLSGTPFGPGLRDTLETVALAALPRVASAFQMVSGISGAIALTLIFWGIATPRPAPDVIQE